MAAAEPRSPSGCACGTAKVSPPLPSIRLARGLTRQIRIRGIPPASVTSLPARRAGATSRTLTLLSQISGPITLWPSPYWLHSFLRAQPGVDAGRIGVTGISWGGYLTSIVASVDDRFRFGIPVYGCGFLSEDSAWLKDFEKLGPERARSWTRVWDPSSYLPLGRRPMFWINGTNDFAYVMSSWQKSYRLPRSERLLSLQVRMKHSHPDGAKPAEIFAYAKWKLLGGPPLLAIAKQGTSADEVWATWKGAARPVKAELCYTRDTGRWQDRTWHNDPCGYRFRKSACPGNDPRSGSCLLSEPRR